MTVSLRRIEWLTAWMIGLAAVELSSHVIDMLGIPLPRLVFGMAWSTALGVVAVLVLWPIRSHAVKGVLGWADVAYLSMIGVWLLSESLRGELARAATLSGILAWLAPWVLSCAVRLHLWLFDDREALIQPFVALVTLMAIVHLGLLMAVRVDLALPFIRPSEVVDRNTISMFLAVAVFFRAVWQHDADAPPSWWFVGLMMFAFIHAELNGARAAKLVLVLMVALQLGRVALPNVRAFKWLCLALSALIVFAVVGISPLLHWLRQPALFGAGDEATSTSYRGETNENLLKLFLSRPWTGVGWHDMLYARSGGYIGHTLYVNIPAAFGLIGLLPALVIGAWRLAGGHIKRWTPERWMTLVLVTAVSSFLNDPVAWYGLALALPSTLAGARDLDVVRARADIDVRFRLNYALAAGTTLVMFVVLAGWVAQRAPYVAATELQFARTGDYVLIAIESSREGAGFVEEEIFKHDSMLRDNCSLSGGFDRQALMIRCAGASPQESMMRVNRIVQPVLERHRALFADRQKFAHNIVAIDRAFLDSLVAWTDSLESGDGPAGTTPDRALLAFVNLQRNVLTKRLTLHDRIRTLEHASRLADGIRVTQRQSLWLLALGVSAIVGILSALAVSLGAAAGSVLEAR